MELEEKCEKNIQLRTAERLFTCAAEVKQGKNWWRIG
jgi:hypothetical protein